jgi:hypothetical protein
MIKKQVNIKFLMTMMMSVMVILNNNNKAYKNLN